ncbi:Porin [Methylorubrum aminovorans]
MMRRAVPCLGLCLVLVPLLAGAHPASAFERAPHPSDAPMEACPSQGRGFIRIPGTTTCIRLSGRVRTGADIGTSQTAPSLQGRIAVDTRSESALGPVRSFVRIEAGLH